MLKFTIFFSIQILINLFLFNNIKKISIFFKVFDIPNKIKQHKQITPVLGGVYLYINFFFYLAFIIFFQKDILETNFDIYDTKQLVIFFFTISFLFLIGLYDDKYHLSSNSKFILTIPLLLLIITIDEGLKVSRLDFSFFDFKVLFFRSQIILSLLSLLAYINLINMFDGINLQSSLHFLAILIILLMVKFIDINFFIFFFIFFLFFCYFNKNEKIFLGDSGTMVLGFLLGYMLLKKHNIDYINSDIIFFITVIPLLDMFRLIILRIINGRNPFHGDRNHLHHRLIKKYNILQTNLIIFCIVFFPFSLSYYFDFKYNLFFLMISFFLYIFTIFATSEKLIFKK